MPRFSARSRAKLDTCHPDLQKVFEAVIKNFDCTILTGHRSQEEQDEKFTQGLSKVKWPDSKHNSVPSRAVDVAPSPIDWEDRERFTYFAGYVLATAHSMGIDLRWGGDWNQNVGTHRDGLKDNRFDDLPHFELCD